MQTCENQLMKNKQHHTALLQNQPPLVTMATN